MLRINSEAENQNDLTVCKTEITLFECWEAKTGIPNAANYDVEVIFARLEKIVNDILSYCNLCKIKSGCWRLQSCFFNSQ